MSFLWAFAAGCAGSGTVTVPGDSGPGTSDPTGPTTPPGPVVLSGIDERFDDDQPTIVWISWEQDADARVHAEYSFDEGIWLSTPERDLAAGPHEELLLGIPFETGATWRLVAEGEGGITTTPERTVRTADAPALMPRAAVLVSEPDRWEAAMTHVLVAVNEGETNATGSWTMLMDRRGRVSWASRSPEGRHTMHPRISWGGTSFLVDHSSFFTAFDGGAASEILELKIDGTEVRRWAVPGQHHPFTDLPDGSLAYASYRGAADGSADDDVVVVVAPDGSERDLFGCAGFLASLGEGGWCGSNTLSYDERRNVFLFSLFTHDSVVELDASTGQPRRWFGWIEGSWAFSPPSSAFDYQHGSYYTEDDTLLVSTHSSPETTELAVREYRLDEETETLVEVWSFGVGEGVVGRQKGEAHRLPGGNTLHNYGTHAVIREATREGEVVWDVRWEPQQYDGPIAHGMGRSAPVLLDLYAFAPTRR